MGSRTEKFLQLQNLRAHYQNMLDMEPTITFERGRKPKLQPERPMTKAEKNRQMDIYNNNQLLFINLRKIGSTASKRIPDFSSQKSKSSEKRRGQSIFVQMQKYKDNAVLLQKLRTIEPVVGRTEQWKHQYKLHKQQLRRLRRSKDVSESKECKLLLSDIGDLKSQLTRSHRLSSARKSNQGSKPNTSINSQHRPRDAQSLHQNVVDIAKEYDMYNTRYDQQEIEEECVKRLKELEIYNNDEQ